jgi:hypothetical protein
MDIHLLLNDEIIDTFPNYLYVPQVNNKIRINEIDYLVVDVIYTKTSVMVKLDYVTDDIEKELVFRKMHYEREYRTIFGE